MEVPYIKLLVGVIALLPGGLLVAYLAIVFQRALWLRWDRGNLEWARAAMLDVATGEALSTSNKRRLSALSPSVQARLFNEFAAIFAGPQSEILRVLAEDIGLTQHLKQRCKSWFWWRRLVAVRTLTLLSTGLGSVEPLLDDRNSQVRYQAIEWAGGTGSEAIASTLIDRLYHGDPFCRYALEDSLTRMGKVASTPLKARLEEKHEDDQALVAMLEVAVRIAGPEYEQIARSLVSHRSPEVRDLCAELLARLGGDDAANTLIEMLDDESSRVASSAARSLGRLKHWPASTRLADLLDDPRWTVRNEAALALANVGAPGILMLQQKARTDDAGGSVSKFALDILANRPGVSAAA